MAVIYAFGDSITYGAWDIEKGGWTSRLRTHLDVMQEADESLYFKLFNLGIPGETSAGLMKRFTAEYTAREREGDEDVVFIFAFGANDVARTEGAFTVPMGDFIGHMNTVISEAKTYTKHVMVLDITPVIEAKTAAPNRRGRARTNADIDEYNRALAQAVHEAGVDFVSVNPIFKTKDLVSLFDEDGLHPNGDGHEIIFREVERRLMSMLG